MTPITRLLDESDASELARYLRDNRPFHAAFDPDRPDDYFTADGQRRRVITSLELHERALALPLVVTEGARIVGRASVRSVQPHPYAAGEVGISLAHDVVGRGWASALLQALCAEAFSQLDLHRLHAGTTVANTAAQRLFVRNHFVEIGRSREHCFIGGEWQDALIYARLATDPMDRGRGGG